MTAKYRNGGDITLGDWVQGHCGSTNRIERGYVTGLPGSGNTVKVKFTFLTLTPTGGAGGFGLIHPIEGWANPSDLEKLQADGTMTPALATAATTP